MSATSKPTQPRARVRVSNRAQTVRTAKRWTTRTLVFVLLGFFAVCFLVPVLWLLLAGTKNGATLLSKGPFAFGSFHDLSRNWHALFSFQGGVFLTWIENSVLYAGAALVITLLISVPAGYALAKMEFRGRKTLLAITLVVMLMPVTALVLPTFLEMNKVGLVDTPLSVILPYSFFPFGVYLTYIYFSTAISSDLLAAARIDGCGEVRTFRSIALPLSTPVVALVGFFSFTQNWNNFFLPYVMLPASNRYPTQVGLTQMLASTPTFNPTIGATAQVSTTELALAALVSIAPVMIVFLVAQRYLVAGLTAGATKE